jgi:hypothetical protein
MEGTYIQKRVYVTYILWDRIYDFLVGEEKGRDVQCKFIQKDNWVNEYRKKSTMEQLLCKHANTYDKLNCP